MNIFEPLARLIAHTAHFGQFRRDGITPYVEHPQAVAESLAGEDDEVLSAAWLHDVIEDTCFTAADLRRLGFPESVVEAVEVLTRAEGQDYNEYLFLVSGNEIARKVKVADIRHNLSCSPSKKQVDKYQKAVTMLE